MNNSKIKRIDLYGVQINPVSFVEAVDLLCDQITRRPAKVVVTPNVDHVISLQDNDELRSLYNSADFVFADGMPLVWSSGLLGERLPARVTGADLFVALCRKGQMHGWHIAIVGGMPGQEAFLMSRFASVYPGLKVSIYAPPMGFDYRSEIAKKTTEWVNTLHADVVFVCLGFPRQCLWSLNNRHTLDAGLVLCVGAAMEFALGLQKRAPLWVQNLGLEWLARLASDPVALWRRYLVRDIRFFPLLWRTWRNKVHNARKSSQ